MDKVITGLITDEQLRAHADKHEQDVRALLDKIGAEVSDDVIRCIASVYGLNISFDATTTNEGRAEFFPEDSKCIFVVTELNDRARSLLKETNRIKDIISKALNAYIALSNTQKTTDVERGTQATESPEAPTEKKGFWTDPQGGNKFFAAIWRAMEKDIPGTVRITKWFKSLLSRRQSQKSSSSSKEEKK